MTFVSLIYSLSRRTSGHDFDGEAIAFKPVLGTMLGRILLLGFKGSASSESGAGKLLFFYWSVSWLAAVNYFFCDSWIIPKMRDNIIGL